jgi:S-adenosylmethionine-dependent methyltransferase
MSAPGRTSVAGAPASPADDLDRSTRTPHTAVVWAELRSLAGGHSDTGAPAVLDVLDVGGGTGGFAVPLAVLGHRVTVVDPSPDALAALQRRAGEAGVDVRAVQGDAAGLLDVVDPASADLALCHGVLEHVDDPAEALAAVAAVLRPGGTLSLLVASRYAAVLARAVAGRFAEARTALADPDGRWGPGDPLPRRFTEAGLAGLLAAAGLSVAAVHGVRTVSDLVPGTLVDGEPGAVDALVELEVATAALPEFRALATQLHVRALRPHPTE